MTHPTRQASANGAGTLNNPAAPGPTRATTVARANLIAGLLVYKPDAAAHAQAGRPQAPSESEATR
jgi:hypothetical protein